MRFQLCRNFSALVALPKSSSFFPTFTFRPFCANTFTNMVSIGTHNGTFHCDEVLACAMLKLLPEYQNASIVRSRDPDTLNKCSIVVDVGGVFDPNTHRYDHHQRTFTETMESLKPGSKWTTRLSSAGLIYCHFGEKILTHLFHCDLNDSLVTAVYEKVYTNFVEEIDAIDNGISTHDGPGRYVISTNLSSRVGHFNPAWNESNVNIDERFHQALQLVQTEFLDRVNYYKNVWWPARETIYEAVNSRQQVDSPGSIIEFSQGGCPWKEHLFAVEKELGIEGEIKFVIYPDDNKNWRVQTVPLEPKSFVSRQGLLESWRGIRDAELDVLVGLEGCVFVHASGFIGGHKTREGALQMARLSLVP